MLKGQIKVVALQGRFKVVATLDLGMLGSDGGMS